MRFLLRFISAAIRGRIRGTSDRRKPRQETS